VRNAQVWAIGDLQGCLTPLLTLLEKIAFDPQCDKLVFCGDLINRGPKSLETLRYVKALNGAATTVLGNHDLHFLAVAAGVRKPSSSDTLQEILEAPDALELVHWLRTQPLALKHENFVITHAGVPPQWHASDLWSNAKACETALAGDHWKVFLSKIFGNEPAHWSVARTLEERQRYTVNALTRMRFVHPDGRLDFLTKEGAAPADAQLTAWFKVANRVWLSSNAPSPSPTIVFGHWSTLGVFAGHDVVSLDGGCVWGGCLAAYLLEGGAPRLEQIQC
jgi:bis(5'-nucleosyl)-tetraphosphatase (symmetrical)